jgi:hypothetical protein
LHGFIPLPCGKSPGFPPVSLQALTYDGYNTANIRSGSASGLRFDNVTSRKNHSGLVRNNRPSAHVRYRAISRASDCGTDFVRTFHDLRRTTSLGSTARYDNVNYPHGVGSSKDLYRRLAERRSAFVERKRYHASGLPFVYLLESRYPFKLGIASV